MAFTPHVIGTVFFLQQVFLVQPAKLNGASCCSGLEQQKYQITVYLRSDFRGGTAAMVCCDVSNRQILAQY